MRLFFYSLFFLCALSFSAQAGTVTLDFENPGLPEFDDVAGFYPGVTLTGAAKVVAGGSVNEFDFPPASGTAEALSGSFDIFQNYVPGTTISVALNPAATAFSGYFTYSNGLNLTFYNGLTVVGLTAGSVVGGGNFGSNELITFLLPSGTFDGVFIDGNNGAFTLDDLTFTVEDTNPGGNVPEPMSVLLSGVGLGIIGLARLRRSQN